MLPIPRILRSLRTALLIFIAWVAGGCHMYRLYEPPRFTRIVFTENSPRIHVLFVGNSLTYYNDLPGLVQQLSAREPKPVDFDVVAVPGVSLRYHWDNGDAPNRIRTKQWDYVILQEYSREPVTDRDTSIASFSHFAELAKSHGATPIFFETWPQQLYPQDAPLIHHVVAELQKNWGGDIAPVGTAWKQCRAQFPKIELYDDEKHPSDAGTYLTACVIYQTLYHKSPIGLPVTLKGLHLDANTATQLQQAAEAATPTSAPAFTP